MPKGTLVRDVNKARAALRSEEFLGNSVFFSGSFWTVLLVDSIFFGGKTERKFFWNRKNRGVGLLVGKAPFFFGVIVWLVHEFGWKMIKKYCFRRCCSEWISHYMRLTRNLKSVFFGWCAFDLFIHWECLIIQHRRYCGYWSGFLHNLLICKTKSCFHVRSVYIYIYISFFQSGLPWQCAKTVIFAQVVHSATNWSHTLAQPSCLHNCYNLS